MAVANKRSSVHEAWQWVDRQALPRRQEEIDVRRSAGRVLASAMIAAADMPAFPRAMMDGYAVRSDNLVAASGANPVMLPVARQILPGHCEAAGRLEPCTVIRIMTGAPMPSGADAVVPVEHTSTPRQDITHRPDVVEFTRSIEPGKNVGPMGEDFRKGETLLPSNRRLRPQDVGLLSSAGVARIPVHARCRVAIVVTGDELLPAGSQPRGHQICDSNGPMLEALVQRDGGQMDQYHQVPDDPEIILTALRSPVDLVIVSGGTSAGREDFAPELVRQHGRLDIHGVAMRPGNPVGLGALDGRIVTLLPGNPVACLCTYEFFAGRLIRRASGLGDWAYEVHTLPLAEPLVTPLGRTDYIRVRVHGEQVHPIVRSGASRLSSTTLADGFVIVPETVASIPAGDLVDVYFYDRLRS